MNTYTTFCWLLVSLFAIKHNPFLYYPAPHKIYLCHFAALFILALFLNFFFARIQQQAKMCKHIICMCGVGLVCWTTTTCTTHDDSGMTMGMYRQRVCVCVDMLWFAGGGCKCLTSDYTNSDYCTYTKTRNKIDFIPALVEFSSYSFSLYLFNVCWYMCRFVRWVI